MQPQAIARNPGATIIRQNEPDSALQILRSGAAKAVLQTASGVEHISTFYFPGDIVNLGTLEGGRQQASVVLLSSGSLCRIPQPLLHTHMQHHPALATALLQAAMQELHHTNWLGVLLSQGSAQERILFFLHTLAQRAMKTGGSGTCVHLAMSRKDMANHLGLAAATVSRTLAHLEQEGILQCSGRTITFRKGSPPRHDARHILISP